MHTGKQTIYKDNYYSIVKYMGITKFTGCQCFKDCDCGINFKPTAYEVYMLSKLWGKKKTYIKETELDAMQFMEQLEKQRKQLNQHTTNN